MTDIDWDARLRDAVAATLAARAARKAERQEFKRRRNFGLVQRYAAKTARLEATMPDVPPCCEGLDEPCPQHRQAQRELRFQGPKRAPRGPSAVVGQSGRARPADPEESQ